MTWAANFKDGERRVVLKLSTLSVVPVVNVTRKNPKPDLVTSYQHASAGKHVLVVARMVGDEVKLFVESVAVRSGMSAFTPLGEERILNAVPKELKDWLYDLKERKYSHILPAGFGWDGIFSESEYNKRQKIRDCILAGNYWEDVDKEWFAELLNQATKTRKEHLMLDWNNALPMTPYIDDRALFDDTVVEIITINNRGEHKLHKRKRMIGNVSDYHGYKVDSTIDKLIVLKYGVMIDEDGTPFGCDIKLYSQ